MSSTTGEKSIRVILFSGQKKEWTIWKAKFLARSNKKPYRYVFNDKDNELKVKVAETTTITDQDGKVITQGPSVEDKQEILNNMVQNADAYDDLLLSMDSSTNHGRIAFNIVRRATYTDGTVNARYAWKRLSDKFEPRTTPNRAKLQNQFFSARCTTNQDPEAYVSYMEDLRTLLEEAGGEPISEEQFITQVVNTLPILYDTLVERLEERVGNKDPRLRLTVEELSEKLSLRFTRNSQNRENGNEQNS
jgi:hypothetical protein